MTGQHWIALAALITIGCSQSPIRPSYLPIRELTPGDWLDVGNADICTPGYTKKIRDVSAGLKRQVFASYGEERREGECCEVDHLVPLELGGSNRLRNLWPQRYDGEWNAKVKDRLEGKLHRLVCSGELDLRTAQQAIARDWVSAYRKFESGEYKGRGTRRRPMSQSQDGS